MISVAPSFATYTPKFPPAICMQKLFVNNLRRTILSEVLQSLISTSSRSSFPKIGYLGVQKGRDVYKGQREKTDLCPIY